MVKIELSRIPTPCSMTRKTFIEWLIWLKEYENVKARYLIYNQYIGRKNAGKKI
jgi:hypothetical protein